MSSSHGSLLTPRQAAARLQLSPGTLANWRALGQGPPFFRVGSRIRYRASDIDAMVVSASEENEYAGSRVPSNINLRRR